jgi:hypothetical protein
VGFSGVSVPVRERSKAAGYVARMEAIRLRVEGRS